MEYVDSHTHNPHTRLTINACLPVAGITTNILQDDENKKALPEQGH